MKIGKLMSCFLKAFMFESSFSMAITQWAEEGCNRLDRDYYKCWQALPKLFNGKKQV